MALRNNDINISWFLRTELPPGDNFPESSEQGAEGSSEKIMQGI